MALDDIKGTEETENIGAICSASFIPAGDISSIASALNNLLTTAVTLIGGKRWYGIEYRFQGAGYTEEGADESGGSLHKYEISFFISKVTAAKTELFRKMLPYRFVLDTLDNNENRKLVGTPDGSLESGLHFKYKEGVKEPVSGKNGYDITFFGQFEKPAMNYDPA